MELRTAITVSLGIGTALLTWRTAFLLSARKPVTGHVVSSTLSEQTRYSPSEWKRAMIMDALTPAEANEPTENATIRVRYTVDARDYFTELPTVVRKGGRPDPTVQLWYDPHDPEHVTDKGMSWLGLGLLYASLLASILG